VHDNIFYMVFLKGYGFHILKVAMIAFVWTRKICGNYTPWCSVFYFRNIFTMISD